MEPWIYIAGLVVLIGGSFLAAAASAKKRREALERLAADRGWQFVRDGREYAAALAQYPLFDRGRSRQAANVLHGGEGEKEFWAFDYRYTTGAGKNSRTSRQTVIVFPHMNVNLPRFELRPEHVFHKIGAALGYQDIDLVHAPAFSSRFLLRGPDAASVGELFDYDLVRAIETERNRCIEGAGSGLVIYRDRETVNAARMLEELNRAERLRDAFVDRSTRTTARPHTWAAESVSV